MTTPIEEAAYAAQEITTKSGNDWKKMTVDELRVFAHGLMQSAAAATAVLVHLCDGDQADAHARIERAGRLANGVMKRHDGEFAEVVERGEVPPPHLVAAHIARMLKELRIIARLIEMRPAQGAMH